MGVLAAQATPALSSAALAQVSAGERPPVRSVQAGASGLAAAAAGPGETDVYLDQGGNAVYRVDDGYNLDQYLGRSESPINFSIDLNRDLGPVDSTGHPVAGNALFGKTARISLRAFDVDDKTVVSGVASERDLTTVNGEILESPLAGADNQWNINTLRFSANELRLPTPSNPTGRNDFEVLVDTANSGADVWKVEVDWAELRLSTEVVPIAMVHGYNGAAADFTAGSRLLPFYERFVPGLDGRAIATAGSRRGSIQQNTQVLDDAISDLLRSSGADRVNLLAHSKGGLESRLFIFDHPDKVDKLVMLGTPNGGTKLADIACAFGAQIFGIPTNPVGVIVKSQFGNCNGPQDGLYQLQPSYVLKTFNKNTPDQRQVFYGTIAGTKNGPASALLDSPDNDSFVTVGSVEYLSRDDPAHRGLHNPLDLFFVNHSGLIVDSNPPGTRAMCVHYESTCGVAGVSANVAASGPAPVTAAASVSFETAAAKAATVPAAGGSVDVALSFESASRALITIVGSGAGGGLGGSFGSTPLEVTEVLGIPVLAATLTAPANGSLRLTNTTGSPIDAAVIVAPETQRRMAVAATPSLVPSGQPVTIAASVSDAVPTDAPRVQVRDESGAVVADATGTNGTINLTFTPPHGGAYLVVAEVDGPRPRRATDTFAVAAGGASIAGGFTEATPDDNGNGLADALVIRTTANATTPGPYRVAARLVDANGMPVTATGVRVNLVAGAQSVELRFDGKAIYDSGLSGPYRVVDVALSRDDASLTQEQQVALLGTTTAYDYRQFEHFQVEIDRDGFSDRGIDTSGDGQFDVLEVTGHVRVDGGGAHAVNARLVASNGTEVGRFQAEASFVAGSNTVTLTFPFQAIRAVGLDGPYTVEDLSIYPLADADRLGYLLTAHVTQPYRLAPPASSCRAAVIRVGGASILNIGGSTALELVPANAAYDPCATATAGFPGLTAGAVVLDLPLATTTSGPGSGAATASVANVRVRGLLGLDVRVTGPVHAEVDARCTNGVPALSGSSSVGRVVIAGIALVPVGTDPFQLPVPGLGTIYFNQHERSTNGSTVDDTITQRAVFFDSTTPLLPDLVVGQVTASVRNC